MKTRKVPMRMCVGCREMKEKKALLRIVRNAQGEISFDRIGKARGARRIRLQIEGMPDESGSPEAA